MSYSIANPNKYQSLAIAGISLALAYLIGARALDTGSLWQYLISFLLIITAIQYSIKAIKKGRDNKK